MARRSPQTAAKRAREQAKRDRRERKQAKKAARKAAVVDGTAWQIVESAAIPHPSGGEFHAYLVTLASGSSTWDVVVEFATSSTVTSFASAEEATRPFLRDDEPPQHLVVERAGAVKLVTEPPKTH